MAPGSDHGVLSVFGNIPIIFICEQVHLPKLVRLVKLLRIELFDQITLEMNYHSNVEKCNIQL